MNSKTEQCLNVKSILERLSGVQDIGSRNRKRFNSDLKKCYYKLCQEFTVCSLELMADKLGKYDHSTALHNISAFNNLYGSPSFECNSIYIEAKAILRKEYKTRIQLINSTKQEHILEKIKYHENEIQKLISQIEIF